MENDISNENEMESVSDLEVGLGSQSGTFSYAEPENYFVLEAENLSTSLNEPQEGEKVTPNFYLVQEENGELMFLMEEGQNVERVPGECHLEMSMAVGADEHQMEEVPMSIEEVETSTNRDSESQQQSMGSPETYSGYSLEMNFEPGEDGSSFLSSIVVVDSESLPSQEEAVDEGKGYMKLLNGVSGPTGLSRFGSSLGLGTSDPFKMPASGSGSMGGSSGMSPQLKQLFASKIEEGSRPNLTDWRQPVGSLEETRCQTAQAVEDSACQDQASNIPHKAMQAFAVNANSEFLYESAMDRYYENSIGRPKKFKAHDTNEIRLCAVEALKVTEQQKDGKTNPSQKNESRKRTESETNDTATNVSELSDEELVEQVNRLLKERCILKSTVDLLGRRQNELRAQNARLVSVARQGGFEELVRPYSHVLKEDPEDD